jgi:hypothetical protein
MRSKGNSEEKEIKDRDSSSDEHIDTNYKSKDNKMFLDIEEKPEIIIEKILINIFNKYITPGNVDIDLSELQVHQNKIKLLSMQQKKSKIIYLLLTKIRSLIKKYREKLFELPNIIELREKIFQKNYKRSYSQNKIISKKYLSFFYERPRLNSSFPKLKKFNYFLVIKNLFCELKNIRNCLRKTAPIIEKIFEEPLSKYAKFSIWECEKEDYLKILIHDDFIWNQIRKGKNPFLNDIISEITDNNDTNLTSMTDRINYFKLIEEYKKFNIDDILKISGIGSSIDTRFPEDAKPINALKEELYETIIKEDKDIRYSYEEADIEDYTNSEEHNNDDINSFKEVTIYKALNKKIVQTKMGGISKSILTNNINININKEDKLFDIPKILKNNDISNEKLSSINNNIEIKNIININKKKKKDVKKKNVIKKESNKSKKKVKVDKNEIPNDIDDLVKYIENDDKTETQNKKKKRNKKRKKKNKNEIKEDKKEEKEEDIKDINNKDDIKDIKEDLVKNSINRFKIHKIKFKYKPKWLNKISKNS